MYIIAKVDVLKCKVISILKIKYFDIQYVADRNITSMIIEYLKI